MSDLTYQGIRVQFDDPDAPPKAYLVRRFAPQPGEHFYLQPWWVEVVSYSPKSKIIRYRRITREGNVPIERMGRLAFILKARPA